MKLHTFQDVVSRIINLSTRNNKPINVTWSGTNAYTNTTTVNLPTLPAGTILSPHQFSIWLGYAIHEGPGHQTHTDLDLYIHTCKRRNNPQFSYILNLLEDIRIENADIDLYPGDRKYLDAVHQFVDSKIPSHMAQNPDTMGLIYKHLFVHHRGLDTNIIQRNLDFTTAQLISEIDHCNSTQDCINLADKIIKYLNQNQEPPPPERSGGGRASSEPDLPSEPDPNKQQNDNNEDEENNDKGAKPNQLVDNNDGENSQPGEETSTPTPSDGNNDGLENVENKPPTNTGTGTKDKNENGNGSQKIQFSDKSTSQWQELTEIKNIIKYLKTEENLPPDLNGKSIFPPQNISNDRIYVPSDKNLSNYNHTRLNCTSQILALKKMFRIYLQAKTQKSQIRGLEEGKLDSHRLYITATGSNLIFKDQHTKFLPFTAVELVIDMSVSMDASIARTAAIILAESLNSIPEIKLSISGFTTNNNNIKSYNQSPNSGRHQGMDILQFKDFNESYAKCKAKLGAINNSGMTPLGDAYGHALEHIISRPEPRRIIFLITDGIPEFFHGENHSDYLLMKKIHLTAQKYRIQTLGLGIGRCEYLDKYFDKTINITEINNLPKNLLSGLKFFV